MTRWLTVLVLVCGLAAPALAQNLRQQARTTATTGLNDSALVQANDSAWLTRAASLAELKRALARGATFDSLRANLFRGGRAVFDSMTSAGPVRGSVGTFGTQTALSGSLVRLVADSGATANVDIFRAGSTSPALNLYFLHNTLADPRPASTATQLGRVQFGGYDSVSYTNVGAAIYGVPEATWSGTEHGASLTFNTTPLGSTTLARSLVIGGGAASKVTGGAGNMILTAGTGNSRTMTLRTTNASGTAKNTLVLGADSSATFLGRVIAADTIRSTQGAFTALAATGAGDVAVCITTGSALTKGATCGSSTRRIKYGIAPLAPANATRTLMALKPSSYTYRPGFYDGRSEFGLIAEEAAAIDKRLAFYAGQDDPKLDIKKGDPINVNDRAVLAALIATVQQQQRTIDSLATRLARLEQRP